MNCSARATLLARSMQTAIEWTLPFFVGIGVPTCAAVALQEPAGALLGCVCGLLFPFADTDKELASRYRIHFLCVFAIALGPAGGRVWPRFPGRCG
jgi:hypothetical protein